MTSDIDYALISYMFAITYRIILIIIQLNRTNKVIANNFNRKLQFNLPMFMLFKNNFEVYNFQSVDRGHKKIYLFVAEL